MVYTVDPIIMKHDLIYLCIAVILCNLFIVERCNELIAERCLKWAMMDDTYGI